MPRRPTDAAPRTATHHAHLDNPYDTTPHRNTSPSRALRTLTGAALITGTALAMSGTAGADESPDLPDDTSTLSMDTPMDTPMDTAMPTSMDTSVQTPVPTSIDTTLHTPTDTSVQMPTGTPEATPFNAGPSNPPGTQTPPQPDPTTPPPAGGAEPVPDVRPDPTPPSSTGTPPTSPGDIAAAPTTQPDPAPPFVTDTPPQVTAAPGDPAPPSAPGPQATEQVPLTPFVDQAGAGSLIDTVSTGQFGSTDTDTTAALDTFIHPSSPTGPATTSTPGLVTPSPTADPLTSTPVEEPFPPAADTAEQVPPTSFQDAVGIGSPTTTTDQIAITGPSTTALDTSSTPTTPTPQPLPGPEPGAQPPGTPEPEIIGQIPSTPFGNPHEDTAAPGDPAPPSAPGPQATEQVPLTPFVDQAGAGSLIDTVSTGQFGSTDTDTTAALDTFIHPSSPTGPATTSTPGLVTPSPTADPLTSTPVEEPTSFGTTADTPDVSPGPQPPVRNDAPLPGTPEPLPTAHELGTPSGIGASSTPDLTMDVQGSTGPVAGPTGENPTGGNQPEEDLSWLLEWLSDEKDDATPAATGPGPDQEPLLSVFDRNFTDYPDPEFLRATEIHEKALEQRPAPWAGLVPPRTPEERAQDGQRARLEERQNAMYLFGDDMGLLTATPFGGPLDPESDEGTPRAGEVSPGAERSAGQLFDVWQRHFERDRRGEGSLSLDGVTPQAVHAYLCLAAARCTGAPPEATIHAGAALANLLDSNGEMTPDGLDDVLTAAEQGMRNLARADEIAATFLPDARLAVTGDPDRDNVIRLSNKIAPNPTVADLLASRFLPEAHAAGPDGTPRTDPLPGSPPGLGGMGVSGRELRAWHNRTLPPVDLASLEGMCQEMASLVCESGYRIPGSSAGPNVLASPERRADLAALNGALSDYWARWQADQNSADTSAAWADVLIAQQDLGRSMREPASRPVPGAGDPAQVSSPRASSAQPGEVARLTSDAQVGVLDALYRNLPSRTWPDGMPITLADFAAALIGPTRVENRDQTFRLLDGGLATGTGAPGQLQGSAAPPSSGEHTPLPASAPADDQGHSAQSPVGSGPSVAPSPGQGGGIVMAPEPPRPNPTLDPNAANRIPQPPPQVSIRPTPPERYTPEPQGGFGDGPQPQVPTTTASPRPDTHGLEMPTTRFPPGPEDIPATQPAQNPQTRPTTQRTTSGQMITAPIPSTTTDPPPSPALDTTPRTTPIRTGPPALRPDSRYPLCGPGASTNCIDPTSLSDYNHDGEADSPGTLILGNKAGPLILGPLILGPLIVGPGPATPAPNPRPTTRPRPATQQPPTQSRPLTQQPVTRPQPVTQQPVTRPQPLAQQPVTRPQPLAQQPVTRPQPLAQQPATPARRPSTPQPQPPSGVRQLVDTAGQLWNNQPLTVRDLDDGHVEVTFMDRRVGTYDPRGNRISGAGPLWLSPLQTATPGRALDEAGQLLDGAGQILKGVTDLIPPIPGWDPTRRWSH